MAIVVLCVIPLALCSSVEAQQAKKVPRIGFLATGNPAAADPALEPFRQGLRELGYIEGQNILIEYRYGKGNVDLLPALAAELGRLKVDVIVAMGTPAAKAAKQAIKTIPIVIAISGDPVGEGIVKSLARPGGNITGVTTLASELSGKRLEVLQDIVPNASRVALLFNRTGSGPEQIVDIEAASRSRGVQLQSFEILTPGDIESAFSAMRRQASNALIVARTTLIINHSKLIVNLATQSRLPAIYPSKYFVEAGGLVSYASDFADSYRRAAQYVDRILKGAKPADLPVEQPTKFELVINLKAAKQIGLTIPPNVLARADRVIR
jgi:putative ABC transport system substrate-binding protein